MQARRQWCEIFKALKEKEMKNLKFYASEIMLQKLKVIKYFYTK